MKAAIYARTAIKDDMRLEDQILSCRKFASEQGFEVVSVHKDSGAGTDLAREGIHALIQEVSNKKFDVILATDFGRFTRNAEHLLEFQNAVQSSGVKLRTLESISDPTEVPKKEWTLAAIAAANELTERDLMTPPTARNDYADFDPAIVELCRAINEFPGIATNGSCQGFIDGHRPDRPWAVYFGMERRPTFEGYCSIEFIAWLKGSEASAAGFDVSLRLNSAPPYLNIPGNTAYFVIEGRNRHPDEFAAFIRDMREKCFFVPSIWQRIARWFSRDATQ